MSTEEKPKIIQIATAYNGDDDSILYALDCEGNVYVRYTDSEMGTTYWRKLSDKRSNK
jgi:hypothetical protein